MSGSSAVAQEKAQPDSVQRATPGREEIERALREADALKSTMEAAHRDAIDRVDQVRRILQNLLDPEECMKELITALDLERQYHEECLQTLKDFSLEGKEPPSFESVSRSFHLPELEAAAQFQSPKLLLMPEVSFADKVRAIDAKKSMLGQIDTYVDHGIYGEFSDDDVTGEKSVGWRAAIVEGATEMGIKPHDDVRLTLGQRVKGHRAASNANGMDRHQYAILQMDGIRRGIPVDQKTWTILDGDEALSARRVPGANWFGGRVGFNAVRPQGQHGDARFRSSVGGDVLIA